MLSIRTIKIAKTILDKIMADPRAEKLSDCCFIENFINGREEGFSIVIHGNKAISFAEYRNVEAIITYTGTWNKNRISEDSKMKDFEVNQINEVVNYILETALELDSGIIKENEQRRALKEINDIFYNNFYGFYGEMTDLYNKEIVKEFIGMVKPEHKGTEEFEKIVELYNVLIG